MLHIFMGKCSPFQACLPIASLNESLEDGDGFTVEVIDTIVDPRSQDHFSSFTNDNLIDARAFVTSLPARLQDIAHRTYWLNQSQDEIATELGVTRSAICHALAKIHTLGRTYFGLATA